MTDLVRTNDDLAREINTEHAHVETYKHNTIRHAIRCGELLLEMKRRVGHERRAGLGSAPGRDRPGAAGRAPEARGVTLQQLGRGPRRIPWASRAAERRRVVHLP